MTDDERKIGPTYRVLSQDLYATDMHGEEIGIRQDELWRSKSRQFSSDAEIIGQVKETDRDDPDKALADKEKTGFIIRRESLWSKRDDKLERRLVAKLFTNSGGWFATIEEMVAEELANSYASDEPLMSFSVITDDNEYLTHIRQMKRGRITTENFGFFILGPDNSFQVFRIEGIRASAGDDYRVISLSENQEVARIDSKFGDIGGEFEVLVKDPVLANNRWFCRVLQCFSVVIKHRMDIKSKIDEILKSWRDGKRVIQQHRYEVSLLGNPRKLTLSREEFEEI
jgi:hypothetical protein